MNLRMNPNISALHLGVFVLGFSFFIQIQGFGSATAPSSSEENVHRLVLHINDNPNPLHGAETPAVDGLIDIGKPALLAVLPLMLSDDENTRIRAQTVLGSIIDMMFGFSPGHGWPDAESQKRSEKLWNDLGNMQYDASKEDREKSIKLWKDWLAHNPTTEQKQSSATQPGHT
jgi:hypothetical protein